MTRDEALKMAMEKIDDAIKEGLCGEKTFRMVDMAVHKIPGFIKVYVPEKLKDAVLEHYGQNGFTATNSGRTTEDTYIIQIGW
jgi:hypothetical protein